MARHKTISFFFAISDIEQPHPVKMSAKEDARIRETGKYDVFIRFIESQRFLLQQDYFDLLRCQFPDGRIIIRRHSYSIPFEFEYTEYDR